MHRLLTRQIKKVLGEKYLHDAQFQNFFTLVSEYYEEKDKERLLLENALVVSSQELTHSNDQLQNMAFYDSLTGLTNRKLFEKELELTLQHVKKHKRNIALLFFDLDNFKNVNDSLGHDVGDMLLIQVSKILLQNIRSCDILARWGGDEFVLLLDELHHRDDSVVIVTKIQKAFEKPIKIGAHRLQVAFSIGINAYEASQDAKQMLKNADIAMYQAKASGKNSYAFYSSYLGEKILADIALEKELIHAIKNNEFVVYYQAQVEVMSGKIVGAEALVRWNHPQKGIISPFAFIPFAEEKGLIVGIGTYVLTQACKDMQKWLQDGFTLENISVNLSVDQIRQENFLSIVKNILKTTMLDVKYLELEVTETMIMHEYEYASGRLEALRSLGITLSIDDFGTGYSSLAYLKRLPINKIKIDKSFIDEIAKDDNDVAIAKAIIAMSHSLGHTVLAEGVEEKPQLSVLKKLKCEKYQGYLCSKPVPAKEFVKLLQEQAKREIDNLFDLSFEI